MGREINIINICKNDYLIIKHDLPRYWSHFKHQRTTQTKPSTSGGKPKRGFLKIKVKLYLKTFKIKIKYNLLHIDYLIN